MHLLKRKEFPIVQATLGEGYIPQVHKIRHQKKQAAAPKWALDDKTLWQRLITPAQAKQFTIAQLYWQLGWTAKEIAERLGTTQRTVEQSIHELRYRPCLMPRSEPRIVPDAADAF